MARSAWITKLFFRYIHALWMFHFVFCIATEGNIYNHTAAMLECKNNGGLASYQLFNPVHRTVTMDNVTNDGPRLDKTVILDEGVSAWVSGYALVTGYFAWEGCYTLPSGSQSTTTVNITQNNNVFNCYHQCSTRSAVKSIGIKEDRCYCLHKSISKSETHTTCHLETDIGVYTNKTLTIIGPATAQCITLLNINHMKYKSVSCLEKHRCLCKCAASDNCPVMNDTMTWHECEQECASLSKSIVPWPDQNDKSKYSNNSTYWLGSFRTFQTTQTVLPEKSENACLSVVKYLDRFYLEPRNCTDRIRYLCHSDIWKDKTDDDTSKGDGGSDSGGDNADQQKQGHYGMWITFVVVIVIVIIIVTIVIIIFIIRRKRNKRGLGVSRLLSTGSNEENKMLESALYHKVSNNDVAANPEQNESPYTHPDEAPVAKIKPDKPIRRTLRKDKDCIRKDYENCDANSGILSKVSGETDQDHSNNTEDDYDRIDKPLDSVDIDKPCKEEDGKDGDKDNVTEDEYDRIDKPITKPRVIPDDHIYDHTHTLDDGIYNTTGTDPDSA